MENEDYISRGVDYNCICIVFLYLASLRPCLNLECHWNGFLEPQGTFYTALNIWVIYDQLALKQINILNIHHNLHVSICVLLFFFLAQLHVKTCILKQYKTCSILTDTQDYNPFKPYQHHHKIFLDEAYIVYTYIISNCSMFCSTRASLFTQIDNYFLQ